VLYPLPKFYSKSIYLPYKKVAPPQRTNSAPREARPSQVGNLWIILLKTIADNYLANADVSSVRGLPDTLKQHEKINTITV
jgi:hypothetical protein